MNTSTYKKKVNKTALRWILKKSKSQLPSIILLVVIYAILAIIGVYLAIASKYLVNAATGNDPSYANDPLSGVTHYGLIFGGIVCADIFESEEVEHREEKIAHILGRKRTYRHAPLAIGHICVDNGKEQCNRSLALVFLQDLFL